MQVTITTNEETYARTVTIADMTDDQYRRLCRIFGHSSRGEVYDGMATRQLAAEVDLVLNPSMAPAVLGEPKVHAPAEASPPLNYEWIVLSTPSGWLTSPDNSVAPNE